MILNKKNSETKNSFKARYKIIFLPEGYRFTNVWQ